MRDGPVKVSLVSFSVLGAAAAVASALSMTRASRHRHCEKRGERCIDPGGLPKPVQLGFVGSF